MKLKYLNIILSDYRVTDRRKTQAVDIYKESTISRRGRRDMNASA